MTNEVLKLRDLPNNCVYKNQVVVGEFIKTDNGTFLWANPVSKNIIEVTPHPSTLVILEKVTIQELAEKCRKNGFKNIEKIKFN